MAEIKLDRVSHSYYAKPREHNDFALKEIDHLWLDGGAYALLGPSGCGKTTLLNIISGLQTPSSGRVLFDGIDVTALSPEDRNIAQVFQFPVIYDTMTVTENLQFPLLNRGVDKAETSKRVAEMLETLELTDKAKRKARGLTADEKQKISLGRGLVRYDVNAVLFDEPLTVIDPQMKWQLRTKLKQLHQRFGHTMVYVTHDQTEALTFADAVVVMYEGEVVQIGTPEELFERPEHTFVGYFIGSPGMNILPCDLSKNVAYIAGHKVPLSSAYQLPPNTQRLELGIRPEFIRLTRGSHGIPVQLQSVEDIGRFRIAKVKVADHPVSVLVQQGFDIPASDHRIVFHPDKCGIYVNDRRIQGTTAHNKVSAGAVA